MCKAKPCAMDSSSSPSSPPSSGMDALRVVLEVHDLEELSLLRAETLSLRRELDMWKGDVPVVGSHCRMDDDLVMMQGWDFRTLSVAWRYDGEVRSHVLRHDGSKSETVQHAFTSPFQHTYDDCFDMAGWIRVYLNTYDLHRVWPDDIGETGVCEGDMYLSSDDRPMQMRNGEYEPMNVLYLC